jgi:hypothetical protein
MDEQNNHGVNAEQSSKTPDLNQGGVGSKKTYAIWVGVLAIILVLGVAGYIIIKNQKVEPTESQGQTSNNQNENAGEVKGDFVEVNWLPTLERQTCTEDWCRSCYNGKCSDNGDIYLTGAITTGEFKGKPLYILSEYSMVTLYSRFVLVDNEPVYLSGDRDIKNPVLFKGVDDFPESLVYPSNPKYILKKGWEGGFFEDLNKDNALKIAFQDKLLGNVYRHNNCLIVKRADHTVLSYNFEIKFLDINSGKVDFVLNNGQKNVEEYDFITPSCGATCNDFRDAQVYDPSFSSSDLEAIGVNELGENLYAYKDPQSKRLKDLYEDKNSAAYWSDGASKDINPYSYQQYIDMRPYIYWQHPLGYWVEMMNKKFAPMAEMCKPVIYLYPTEQKEMTVEVYPNGGFIYTNPVYNGGWKVLANPNGLIKDLTDGKIYDYLFWEGLAFDYPENSEGFVVAREGLNNFFDQKLSQLGFNDKELSDFKDYWLGRLSEKPYYEISFLLNSDVDKIAPLKISENPDTIIRVLIHAKGLEQFKKISPQILPKNITRKGFTVVEWGGSVAK